LRHAPLLLVREMARSGPHRALVAETLARVIQRADELSEFVAIYWAGGRQPLSAQVKKGLAAAFGKFDEYALAKYDRAGAVRLRDVLFLCHARPVDEAQAALWKRLVDNELATPDTWEVALSAAGRGEGDKRAAWERLLADRKLGALALLRNLRNLREAGVSEELVQAALAALKTDRVLPFRFLAAARVAPQWEQPLEAAMFRSLESRSHEGRASRLSGHTVLLVDVSGSMEAPLSRRSEMRRTDAAYGLAILLREIAEKATIYTFSDDAKLVPSRRGMALRDALEASQPHSATYLGKALSHVEAECRSAYDRLIVITDEQSHDTVPAPRGKGYVINVASNRNGVGYGPWTHIDGWSEAVIDYIAELEAAERA
ncbi:MAG: TROVE domain-containing protein, partial [Terracidiphilus sp.]